MYIQVVHLEVSPDKTENFLAEISANIRASREEPGVAQFDLLRQAEKPNHFMLYEVYTSPEALEAHRLTPHFKRWLEHGVPLLTGERVKVIYNLVDCN